MNMRLAVLDVGSNTVHLLVVDAHLGAHPWPAHSVKAVLRLAEQIGKDGRLSKTGADSLVASVLEARDAAAKLDTEDLLAFATSAVRDAKNSAEVLARVRKETGVELRVLSGEGEARMTFLAVRRWYGWSAGNLLVLDIGGGSLEIGVGIDEEPVQALSLSLGAGRMTRQFLNGDPPRARDIDALTEFAEDALDQALKTVDITGWEYRIGENDIHANSIGFIGLAAALLGRNTALGVGLASLLFGALINGTSGRQLDPSIFRPDLAGNLTTIIQGLVILFVGLNLGGVWVWLKRRRRA